MSNKAREVLARAVRRHREHRGWSRPQMAASGLRMLREDSDNPDDVRFSGSTIKNVEARRPGKGWTQVTGRTAGVIERLFEWPTGTVANILAGEPPPEPLDDDRPETPREEDDRAFVTFRTWPRDVQDVAMLVGQMLAFKPDAERRELRDQIIHIVMPDRP